MNSVEPGSLAGAELERSLPEFSTLALHQVTRRAPASLGAAVPVQLSVNEPVWPSPINPDGTPNLAAPAVIRSVDSWFRRTIISPPNDAPDSPKSADFDFTVWGEYRGNWTRKELKFKISDLSGTVVGEEPGAADEGYNHPLNFFFGQQFYTDRFTSSPVTAQQQYCDLKGDASGAFFARWSVPTVLAGTTDYGGQERRVVKTETWSCAGEPPPPAPPSGGGGGGGPTYILTTCWGYHVYDANGNYMYTVVEGCAQYEL